MTNMATLPEHLDFLYKIVQLTRKGQMSWDTTADPDVLLASLGEQYTLKLEQVPDLDRTSEEPDQQLTLMKGTRPIFILDRTGFPDHDDFRKVFPGEKTYPYTIFKELWERASMKANRVADELERVNSILDARMKGDVP